MSDEGAAHGGGGKRKRTCRGTHQGKQRPRNTVTQGRQASAERVLKEYWPEERVLPPAEDVGVFRFWPAPLSLDVVVSSSVFLFVVSGETDTTAHSTWRRGCFSVLGLCPGSGLRAHAPAFMGCFGFGQRRSLWTSSSAHLYFSLLSPERLIPQLAALDAAASSAFWAFALAPACAHMPLNSWGVSVLASAALTGRRRQLICISLRCLRRD